MNALSFSRPDLEPAFFARLRTPYLALLWQAYPVTRMLAGFPFP